MADREDVTMGGIVTSIQSRFGKNNKPWGIVTLEDFHGSGELVLFGDDWLNLNGKFIEGAAVYIVGKMQPRFFNSEQKELKVSNVELLQSVKERAIDRITIVMSTDLMNDTIVTELGTLIADNPGKTKLFVQLHDGSGKNHVLLRSTTKTVDVKHSLIHFIEQSEGLDYRIN
jgi:DNA polymerase-3 subunit alpha